jgi:hypothetical protein
LQSHLRYSKANLLLSLLVDATDGDARADGKSFPIGCLPDIGSKTGQASGRFLELARLAIFPDNCELT